MNADSKWEIPMPIPRVSPLIPPFTENVAATLSKMMPPGEAPLKLFTTIANHPRLLQRFSVLGGGILHGGLVEPRDREIVIHRTCARCNSEYEWGVHAVVFGKSLGFGDEMLRATVHGDAADSVWSERQSLLVRLADELFETATVSDNLWALLENGWSHPQLIELIITAGFYRLVSYLTNALKIDRETNAMTFKDLNSATEG